MLAGRACRENDRDTNVLKSTGNYVLSQVSNESEGEHHDLSDWLRELLSGGQLPARQVEAEAQNIGIPFRKLQRAMKRAGVETVREGFGRDAKYIRLLKGSLHDAPPSRLAMSDMGAMYAMRTSIKTVASMDQRA